jgi:hypothetical protein
MDRRVKPGDDGETGNTPWSRAAVGVVLDSLLDQRREVIELMTKVSEVAIELRGQGIDSSMKILQHPENLGCIVSHRVVPLALISR